MAHAAPASSPPTRSAATTSFGVAALTASLLLARDGGGSRAEDWELEAPAPVVELAPDAVDAGPAAACATCHAGVVEEWRHSAHGIAWLDEYYQEAIAEKSRPETCHSCHVPQNLLAGDELPSRPRARTEDLVHGITCNVCHLGPDGAYLGSRGGESIVHATRVSEVFSEGRANALCAVCHRTNIGPVVGVAKDFERAGMAERGRSCIGCHMRVVERTDPEGATYSGRSHLLQTPRDPAFLRRAFGLELRDGGVAVTNQAGHRVPGLVGREITFEARALDPGGSVLGEASATIDTRTYLAVDGELVLELDTGGAAAVEVTAVQLDPRHDDPLAFLDERLEP